MFHQGAADIERHADCKTHKQRIVAGRNQSRLSFASISDSGNSEVTAA